MKTSKYYDKEGHLKYILDSKELTELAKEVAAAVLVEPPDEAFNVAKDTLLGRGIAWCDDE